MSTVDELVNTLFHLLVNVHQDDRRAQLSKMLDDMGLPPRIAGTIQIKVMQRLKEYPVLTQAERELVKGHTGRIHELLNEALARLMLVKGRVNGENLQNARLVEDYLIQARTVLAEIFPELAS